nr:hypothetical protein BaRGS_011976 [Batillaria attramentaria]
MSSTGETSVEFDKPKKVEPREERSPSISKCTDCNIIFYKHENYLVHKKVYCSGKKNRLDRPSSPDSRQSPEGLEPGETDKRLAEHMKVHNPTSAYRCTLCGYRGNTVRGMRMHGKTHTDNGEDFTDNHMVEFQEPPLVPIQTNSDKTAQGPLDLEAELIRLKNEPYKRRRSRKAFEKVDILAVPDQPHACHICGECFSESRSFAMHMRIHEIASQYNQALVHCDQCEYVAKSLDDLRAHIDISHSVIPREEKENHPESLSPARTPSSERDATERRTTPHGKLTPVLVSVKIEPVDTGEDESDSGFTAQTSSDTAVDDHAVEDVQIKTEPEENSADTCRDLKAKVLPET